MKKNEIFGKFLKFFVTKFLFERLYLYRDECKGSKLEGEG